MNGTNQKKRLPKRFFSLVLTLAVMVSLAAAGSLTANAYIENYTYDETTGVLTMTGEDQLNHDDFAPFFMAHPEQPVTGLVLTGFTSVEGYLVEYLKAYYALDLKSTLVSIEAHDLTAIEPHAFNQCSALTMVKLPEEMERIGESAFEGCENLTEITLPMGLTEIEEGAFRGCASLPLIVVPEGVTAVSPGAFSGCKALKTVSLPESLTFLNDSAFEDCASLTQIDLPSNVTAIGAYAFSGCTALTEFTVPEGVTVIRRCLFDGCTSLTAAALPEGVTAIESYAFRKCSSLTELVIPETVTKIESSAVRDCESLSLLVFMGTVGGNGSGISNTAFYHVGMNTANKPTVRFPSSWTENLPDPKTGEFMGGYFKTVSDKPVALDRTSQPEADEDEYIVCTACGYHNWTPEQEGFRCDNCGALRGVAGAAPAPAAVVRSPKTGDTGTAAPAGNGFALLLLAALAAVACRRKSR